MESFLKDFPTSSPSKFRCPHPHIATEGPGGRNCSLLLRDCIDKLRVAFWQIFQPDIWYTIYIVVALKRRSQIVWYREIPCTTKRLSREKEKKRCWRQALSFLSDNPRHYTPPSLYTQYYIYIRRELERCTRLQPYWKKSLFRTT